MHRDVQTDKTDGDQFIAIPAGSNGRLAYRKVHLRTCGRVVACCCARALADVQYVVQVRQIIKFLAGSRAPEEERRRIAQVARIAPLIPPLDLEETRRELDSNICEFGEWRPGQIPEDAVGESQAAAIAGEHRAIRLNLGGRAIPPGVPSRAGGTENDPGSQAHRSSGRRRSGRGVDE